MGPCLHQAVGSPASQRYSAAAGPLGDDELLSPKAFIALWLISLTGTCDADLLMGPRLEWVYSASVWVLTSKTAILGFMALNIKRKRRRMERVKSSP